MTTVATATVVLEGESAQLTNALKTAEQAMVKAGQRFQEIGSTLTKGLTLPLAGLGFAAGKAFVDFESSFAGIRKTMNLTNDEFQKLSDSNRELAKVIPISVNELNRIGELAGQLGVRGVSNVLKFEDTIAKLAVTTDLTAEQGALAFAQIANILQLPQDQIDRLGASIVGLGNNFATVESKIVDFTQRIAGAGKIAGLSAGDVTGIGTAFASVGVEAEAGGTSVQKVLISMVESVNKGGPMLEKFAKVSGITSSQFIKNFRDDAGQTFAKFIEGLGKQGERGIQTLEDLELQDQRIIRAFLSVAGAGDLLARAIKTGNAEFEKNTALTNEANKRFETSASQLKLLWNRMQDVAITLGGALVPIMLRALDALKPFTDLIITAVDAFTKLPVPVQTVVVAIAGFAAALGPVIFLLAGLVKAIGILKIGSMITGFIGWGSAVLGLIPSINSLGAALALLQVAIGPVGWVVLGVSAIVAILGVWLTRQNEQRRSTEDATTALNQYRVALVGVSAAQLTASRGEMEKALIALRTQLGQQEAALLRVQMRVADVTSAGSKFATSNTVTTETVAKTRAAIATLEAQLKLLTAAQGTAIATDKEAARIKAEQEALAAKLRASMQGSTIDTEALTKAVEALKESQRGQGAAQAVMGVSYDGTKERINALRTAIEAFANAGIKQNQIVPGMGVTLAALGAEYQRLVASATATELAQNTLDEVFKQAATAIESATAPIDKLVALQGVLNVAYISGQISLDQYNASMQKAANEVIGLDKAMEAYKQLVEQAKTPQDKYNDSLARLNLLAANGKITQLQFAQALAGAQKELDSAKTKTTELGGVLENVAQRGTDAFLRFSSSSSNAFVRLIDDAIRQLIRLAAHKLFNLIFKVGATVATGGGFSLGKIFTGFFAEGGYIPSGQMGVVGERGPELLTAGRAGLTVTPMQDVGERSSGSDLSGLASSILAQLGPAPSMSPEAAAVDGWYRRLFGALVADGRRRGVV